MNLVLRIGLPVITILILSINADDTSKEIDYGLVDVNGRKILDTYK